MKKTKIIATLGPSSDSVATIRKLYENGMNVARLNFSHGSYEYFEKLITNVRKVSDKITILLDTKGPEIRTSKIEGDDIVFNIGDKLTFSNNVKIYSTKKCVQLNYNHLFKVEKGNEILIDDGSIVAEVLSVSNKNKSISAVIKVGGMLGSNKTVSIHGHNVELPFLSRKDKEDILFGIKHNVDVVAASFVREKSEIIQLKKFLEKNKGSYIKVISKIEHAKALDDIQGIVEESFGIMVARGDLGVEAPIETVPFIQEQLIALCNELGKPVIVATQMLESMKKSKLPTRAEVNDVAQAILQGSDCVMLSSETANGKFPIDAVQMMSKIAKEYDHRVESYIADNLNLADERIKKANSLFITKSAYYAAQELGAKYIFVPTETGYSARKISRFKPQCSILAVCSDMNVFRQVNMSWGVEVEFHKGKYKNNDSMKNQISKKLLKEKKVSKADIVVIASGKIMNVSGHTNTLEIYSISDLL